MSEATFAEKKFPSVTKESILSKIVKETYTILPESTVTICHLTLQNGYTVTGESACVDPRNFNKEEGEHWAKENAISKIWTLEGYLLKEDIYRATQIAKQNGVIEE